MDDYKAEYRNLGGKPTANLADGEQPPVPESVIRALKSQANSDRNYLLYRKILPVSTGLVLLTLVVIFTHFPNWKALMGSLFIFISLASILALFLKDLMAINKDSYGLSVVEYLKEKRQRIRKWRRIPIFYSLIYCLFILGVLLLIPGSTDLEKVLQGSRTGAFIYMAIIIVSLVISGIVGGWKHRKRFKKEHLPLINEITRLLDELRNEEDYREKMRNA